MPLTFCTANVYRGLRGVCRFSLQTVNITPVFSTTYTMFPLEEYSISLWFLQPLSIDIAVKTYRHPVNPRKHLQCALSNFYLHKNRFIMQALQNNPQTGKNLEWLQDEPFSLQLFPACSLKGLPCLPSLQLSLLQTLSGISECDFYSTKEGQTDSGLWKG